MKRRMVLILLLVHLVPGISFADAPKSIAGITLGANIKDIADRLDTGSALPLWRSEYLSKVELKPIKGYRSGYVVNGRCKDEGRIVRIKLSYEDESSAFFDELHSGITKRYGKPVEWRGNPFGSLKVWKWSMKDDKKNSIGIILERYEGDDDSFTPGNSIRLTNNSHIEEEKACFEAKAKKEKEAAVTTPVKEKLDFDWFLPH